MALIIQPLSNQDLDQAINFAIHTRILLFPEVYEKALPYELTHFSETYIQDPLGACWIIKDQDRIIAMIAYRAYNRRFQLDLPHHCVELVKLFVEPQYRKQGFAQQLCKTLFEYAAQKNIHHFYLHTHPFLTGAEYFWQQQGFEVIHRELIQEYDTIHMFKKT